MLYFFDFKRFRSRFSSSLYKIAIVVGLVYFFYVGDSKVSKQVYQKFQRRTSEVSNQVGINKTIFNISKTNPTIDKIIKKYGHDKETLIDQLATLPLPDLQSEYNNNLNKYYMKLAIEKKNGG